MNKCYLSFYMPKVLAISPFSNVYVFKLIITHKTEKKKKDFWKLLESQNILILHSLDFFCSQCFSNSYCNFKNPFVFPTNLQGKRKEKKTTIHLQGCDILLEQLSLLKLQQSLSDFISDPSEDRYGFINFRHQCKSTINVLYNHMMFFHKHTG